MNPILIIAGLSITAIGLMKKKVEKPLTTGTENAKTPIEDTKTVPTEAKTVELNETNLDTGGGGADNLDAMGQDEKPE